MKRTANAHWTGSIRDGKGELTTQSGMLDKTNYSFNTRFTGAEKGTNPEELLVAAHAGCFTMAVSFALTEKGWTIVSLDTEATLSMEGFDITGIQLAITGNVPGITADEFNTVATAAAQNCLISKVLNLPISVTPHLMP